MYHIYIYSRSTGIRLCEFILIASCAYQTIEISTSKAMELRIPTKVVPRRGILASMPKLSAGGPKTWQAGGIGDTKDVALFALANIRKCMYPYIDVAWCHYV